MPVTLSEAGGLSGSGTTNYIPKWTPDGFTLGNSQIFDDGTNVGIGTTIGAAKFTTEVSVNGDGIYLTTSNAVLAAFQKSDVGLNGYLALYENGNTATFVVGKHNYLPYSFLNDGKNFGLGTTTPTGKFHVVGANSTGNPTDLCALFVNSSNAEILKLRNDGTTFFNNSAYINTGSAFQSLLAGDYLGTLNNNLNIVAGISTPGSNAVRISYYGNTQWLTALSIQNSGAFFGNLLLMPDGGNVAIGTSSPTAKLHVVGLVEYADNATALLGGLTVGAFYHTAGILKVVV